MCHVFNQLCILFIKYYCLIQIIHNYFSSLGEEVTEAAADAGAAADATDAPAADVTEAAAGEDQR